MADETPDAVTETAQEALEHLEKIGDDIEVIKEANSTGRWFVRGMLQGAGAVVGSVFGLIALGWILSILGVIPGFGDIASYLQGAAERATGR